MSNGEVLVSGGEASENGEFILRRLPPWMPVSESDGNFKLLDVVGRAFDRVDGEIDSVDAASSVQTAESVSELRELAKLVELLPKTDESVEKYRKRTVGEFQAVTSEGTLENLFTNISTLLEIEKSKISYDEGAENGAVLLSVPGNAMDSVALTQSEFAEILGKQSAAGFRVDVQSLGTFTYLGEDEYTGAYTSGNGGYDSAELTSDATRGHDGLDVNGDPKDNGGTYAGLLS